MCHVVRVGQYGFRPKTGRCADRGFSESRAPGIEVGRSRGRTLLKSVNTPDRSTISDCAKIWEARLIAQNGRRRCPSRDGPVLLSQPSAKLAYSGRLGIQALQHYIHVGLEPRKSSCYISTPDPRIAHQRYWSRCSPASESHCLRRGLGIASLLGSVTLASDAGLPDEKPRFFPISVHFASLIYVPRTSTVSEAPLSSRRSRENRCLLETASDVRPLQGPDWISTFGHIRGRAGSRISPAT